jgi:hypothetical protein
MDESIFFNIPQVIFIYSDWKIEINLFDENKDPYKSLEEH